MKNPCEGRQDGDEVIVASVYFSNEVIGPKVVPVAKVFVREMTVFHAGRGLLDPGNDGPPRSLGGAETIHDTPKSAWLLAAEECREAAGRLLDSAEECERKARLAKGDVAATEAVA
jgi:hypothetical protein